MNPPEVRDLLGKADDAIEASLEGEEEEAGQNLREIAREIDDKLEGETRQEALGSLVDLANALGISLEPDEDQREDDDDDD